MSEGDARLPRFNGDGREDTPFQTSKTTAERVNALDVYEDAVQEPLLECSNLASMYYNAQPIGSFRPEARVLREDFCSSAIVAQSWLGLDRQNKAQGVDIDLAALRVARRRIQSVKRPDRTAAILQAGHYSQSGKTERLADDEIQTNEQSKSSTSNTAHHDHKQPSTSTWAQGAASDRFERRFQARLAKEKGKGKASTNQAQGQSDDQKTDAVGDVLVLQHADVLSLPLQDVEVESPDIVYAGNYALSYFHDRHTLLAYLAQCRRTLRPKTGVLIVDPFAGPTSWNVMTQDERTEQEERWTKFASEPGFVRNGEHKDPPAAANGDLLEFWQSPSSSQTCANAAKDSSHWRNWPRGRLVLVRRGHVGGGYEYWREDGPLDYATNRFRMSLSFRFTDDKSWLRDYFSYDFRVWSLREITEAMEEVGFVSVQVHAIPRATADDHEEEDTEAVATKNARGRVNSNASVSTQQSKDEGDNDDVGLDGMAALMQNIEKNEAQSNSYTELKDGQKLFATRSFGTYIVACMPSDDL